MTQAMSAHLKVGVFSFHYCWMKNGKGLNLAKIMNLLVWEILCVCFTIVQSLISCIHMHCLVLLDAIFCSWMKLIFGWGWDGKWSPLELAWGQTWVCGGFLFTFLLTYSAATACCIESSQGCHGYFLCPDDHFPVPSLLRRQHPSLCVVNECLILLSFWIFNRLAKVAVVCDSKSK